MSIAPGDLDAGALWTVGAGVSEAHFETRWSNLAGMDASSTAEASSRDRESSNLCPVMAGVRVVALVTHDGVPVAVPGSGMPAWKTRLRAATRRSRSPTLRPFRRLSIGLLDEIDARHGPDLRRGAGARRAQGCPRHADHAARGRSRARRRAARGPRTPKSSGCPWTAPRHASSERCSEPERSPGQKNSNAASGASGAVPDARTGHEAPEETGQLASHEAAVHAVREFTMVQINFAQKQVKAKIVYYGPGMSGKTTNLEVVHQRAPDTNRGDLTSISTDGDRTLFFDYMPLELRHRGRNEDVVPDLHGARSGLLQLHAQARLAREWTAWSSWRTLRGR